MPNMMARNGHKCLEPQLLHSHGLNISSSILILKYSPRKKLKLFLLCVLLVKITDKRREVVTLDSACASLRSVILGRREHARLFNA